MTEAIAAIDIAVFAALDGNVAGATVYQDVPENAAGSIIIIGDIEQLTPIGAPGDPDRRGQITIIVLTEDEERAPCAAMVADIEHLDGVVLDVEGWQISLQTPVSSCTLAPDGVGYLGTILFTVFALSA